MDLPKAIKAVNKMKLEELLPLLGTATGELLEAAVDRALQVTKYPVDDDIIPLPEELTAEQRKVVELLATRSGLTNLSTVAIPQSVQLRRRWLGLDPPELLERPVELKVGKKKLTRPLWWACRYLQCEGEDEAIAKLLTAAELFQIAVEAEVWEGELYGLSFDLDLDEASAQASKAEGAWAARYLDEIIAWPRAEDAGEVDGISYASAPRNPGGRGTFEAPLDLSPGAASYLHLLTAVAASGGKIAPAWEPFLPWGHENTAKIIPAVAADRRDAAFLAAFHRELPKDAINASLMLLPALPSKAIAEATAQLLEAPEQAKGPAAKLLAGWQREWASLEKRLPAGVWRPLGGGKSPKKGTKARA